MEVVKTVRVPVHYALTERKRRILDRLTARLTYGIWLWSKRFDEHNLKGTYADRTRFYERVKAEARLPGHMVQCCSSEVEIVPRESPRQNHPQERVVHKPTKRLLEIVHKRGRGWLVLMQVTN